MQINTTCQQGKNKEKEQWNFFHGDRIAVIEGEWECEYRGFALYIPNKDKMVISE